MARTLTGSLAFVLAVAAAVTLLPVSPLAQAGVRTVTVTTADLRALRDWAHNASGSALIT